MRFKITQIHNKRYKVKGKKIFWIKIRNCRKEMYVLHSGRKLYLKVFLLQITIRILIIQKLNKNSLKKEIKSKQKNNKT